MGPKEGKHRGGSVVAASFGSRIHPLTGKIEGPCNFKYQDFSDAGIIPSNCFNEHDDFQEIVQ